MHRGKHTVTKTAAVTIGSAAIALADGQRKTITVHLTGPALASIKAAEHHRLAVAFQVARGDGASTSAGTVTLVLAPARAKHKKK